jgi:hypothetical protein
VFSTSLAMWPDRSQRRNLLPTISASSYASRTDRQRQRRGRNAAAAARGTVAAAGVALLLALLVVVVPALPPWLPLAPSGCQQQQEVVVSVATLAQRLQFPFPAALRSLLRQTAADCSTVWVFIPQGDRGEAEDVMPQLEAAAQHAGRIVYLHFVADRRGPPALVLASPGRRCAAVVACSPASNVALPAPAR